MAYNICTTNSIAITKLLCLHTFGICYFLYVFEPFPSFSSRPTLKNDVPTEIHYLKSVSQTGGVHSGTDFELIVHEDDGLYHSVPWSDVRDEGVFDYEMSRVPRSAHPRTQVTTPHTDESFQQTEQVASGFRAGSCSFHD